MGTFLKSFKVKNMLKKNMLKNMLKNHGVLFGIPLNANVVTLKE